MDGGSPLVKDLDELINGAPTFHKGLVKWTFIRYCAINWSTEGLPEKFVVQVAASVELDQFGQRYAALEVVTSLGFCLLLEELVKVVDVGSVVLAIVEIQQETTDDGLKCSDLVGQSSQLNTLQIGRLSGKIFLDQVVNHCLRYLRL